MRARNSNALASYIVLTCRPRHKEAQEVTKKSFVCELRQALKDATPELISRGISPVDISQAIIGPGMAVFSKYSAVILADGRRMSIREALLEINRTLDFVLEEDIVSFDRDTMWALEWFKLNGFDAGSYGEAELLSRAKNT